MHSESSAIELSELDKRYAQKPSVDTVIGRVKALEASNDELKDRVTQNANGVNDHDIKLAEILKRLKDHDTNLETHQMEIDQLKRQVEALSNVDTEGGNIDATALLRKIHFLEQKLDDKADKIEVIQARAYTDDQVSLLRKDLEKIIDAMRAELTNFREAWELFHTRDWKDIVSRVETLEKRMTAISKLLENGGGVPEYSSGGKMSDEMVL